MALHLADFEPDRFVGGDDPRTTIKVFASRIECLERQEQVNRAGLERCMNLVGATIRQHGGEFRLKHEFYDSLPEKFVINFIREGDELVLTMVVACER